MVKQYSATLRGAIALFTLASIYGFIGYFSRELAPGLSLWQQLYVRLVIALPLLWLTFHKRINFKNSIDLVKKEPYLVVLRSVCLYTISVPLFFYAAQHAKLGNVAFLQVLPYIFILGVIVNKEKLTKQKTLLMLIAMVGAYLIAVKNGLDFSNIGKGELASIVSGFLFALGFVTRKKHKVKANDFEISFTLMAIGLAFTLIISLFAGDKVPHPATTDVRFFVLLIVAGYINSLIIVLANYGFSRVKDTYANNIMALEGTFAVMFGYLIYHEVPSLREVIGAIIILVSAIVSAYVIKETHTDKSISTEPTLQV